MEAQLEREVAENTGFTGEQRDEAIRLSRDFSRKLRSVERLDVRGMVEDEFFHAMEQLEEDYQTLRASSRDFNRTAETSDVSL